jgi:hypothetical protein
MNPEYGCEPQNVLSCMRQYCAAGTELGITTVRIGFGLAPFELGSLYFSALMYEEPSIEYRMFTSLASRVLPPLYSFCCHKLKLCTFFEVVSVNVKYAFFFLLWGVSQSRCSTLKSAEPDDLR